MAQDENCPKSDSTRGRGGNSVGGSETRRANKANSYLINFKLHLRLLAFIVLVVTVASSSGCGTIGTHLFRGNSNEVYGGVREDISGCKDWEVWWLIDVPFSLVGDTLFLPWDIYYATQLPPAIDPLNGWKCLNASFPADHLSPPVVLSKAVMDDYRHYIKKLNYPHGPDGSYFENYGGSIEYFEDGTGKHAVKVAIPFGENPSTVKAMYIMFYDKSDVRTKVIKYMWFEAFRIG